MIRADQVHGVTEHGVGDGEGERGSARHPPAGAQVSQLNPQHLHDHLVVQGQIEVMLVCKLQVRTGQVSACPSCPWTQPRLSLTAALIPARCFQRNRSILLIIHLSRGSQTNRPVTCAGAVEGKGARPHLFTAPRMRVGVPGPISLCPKGNQ